MRDILGGISIYLIIIIGIPLTFTIGNAIYQLFVYLKYKKILKKLSANKFVNHFDNINQQYQSAQNQYQSLKGELISDFKFKFEKKGKTIEDYIQDELSIKKERIENKRRQRYWSKR
jgi:hypothetical protein